MDVGTISARSRNLDGAVFDGSRSLFLGGGGGGVVIFASQSGILFYYYYITVFCLRVSDPRICHFFFPFGLQKSNFSEFIGTAYRKGLVDLDRKTRQSSILVDLR